MDGWIPVQAVLPAWRYHAGRGGHRAVWSFAGIELHRLWVCSWAVCCLQLLTASLAVLTVCWCIRRLGWGGGRGVCREDMCGGMYVCMQIYV